jgi:hypothetical protein
MIAAIEGHVPDRLPVTTHHVMPYFLLKYVGGISNQAFFDHFQMDAILWTVPHKPGDSGDGAHGNAPYYDPEQGNIDFLQSQRIASDDWRIYEEEVPNQEYHTVRYRFVTPGGELSMVLQSDPHTTWVAEHLIKKKSDIDLIGQYATAPRCDVETVNQQAAAFGDRGIVRGHICTFDVFGQPGTWQDAACLVGIEKLILATYDDPEWVHAFLRILQRRKKTFVRSLAGAAMTCSSWAAGMPLRP